jgi:hypothetical protein
MLLSCPRCHSACTIPVQYGKPGGDLIEAESRGLVKLAGCVMGDIVFTHYCTSCQHTWRHQSDDLARLLLDGEVMVMKLREEFEMHRLDSLVDVATRYGASMSTATQQSSTGFREVAQARRECLEPWDQLLRLIRSEKRDRGISDTLF